MNRVSGTAAASIKHQLEGRDSEFYGADLCRSDGRQEGAQEGQELGLQKGFELAQELGFYRGCLQVHAPTFHAMHMQFR